MGVTFCQFFVAVRHRMWRPPYFILGRMVLECRYGPERHKKQKNKIPVSFCIFGTHTAVLVVTAIHTIVAMSMPGLPIVCLCCDVGCILSYTVHWVLLVRKVHAWYGNMQTSVPDYILCNIQGIRYHTSANVLGRILIFHWNTNGIPLTCIIIHRQLLCNMLNPISSLYSWLGLYEWLSDNRLTCL